ncbi:MAG: hypothetical protein M1826_002597 [Phylliscum demangeonii]|nr:MAG: hypothetical protein M1826_002597 [Phylliscum demangeonii]
MAVGSLILRGSQTTLRLAQFLSSLMILGIFAYFLAKLRQHRLRSANWVRATTGLAALGLLWALIAMALTCFMGGVTAFGLLGLVLDLLFVGAFIAIAIMNRGGVHRCRGYVSTPMGDGYTDYPPNSLRRGSYVPNYKAACRLEKGVFIVALITLLLFLLTAIGQYLLYRHARNERRYGTTTTTTEYATGAPAGRRRFFAPKAKTNYTRDAELATAGATVGTLETEKHAHIRPSAETGYTGTTATGPVPVATYDGTGQYTGRAAY